MSIMITCKTCLISKSETLFNGMRGKTLSCKACRTKGNHRSAKHRAEHYDRRKEQVKNANKRHFKLHPDNAARNSARWINKGDNRAAVNLANKLNKRNRHENE